MGQSPRKASLLLLVLSIWFWKIRSEGFACRLDSLRMNAIPLRRRLRSSTRHTEWALSSLSVVGSRLHVRMGRE